MGKIGRLDVPFYQSYLEIMAVGVDDIKLVEEKKLIQRAYRNLLKAIKSKMDDTDRRNIRMAYEMAVEAHKKQRRKSGEPYILHPIEVARICAVEIGLGPTAIVSALLHDVVEDTEVTLKDIREKIRRQNRDDRRWAHQIRQPVRCCQSSS